MRTKARTAHFIFKEGTKYKDLKEIYPKVLEVFLTETGQMPEDRNLYEIWLERDMKEMERNRKPEGYLKQNAIKQREEQKAKGEIECYDWWLCHKKL